MSGSRLSGCRISRGVRLADEVVTEIGFVADCIRDGRSSALRVVTQVRDVAEIVSNCERLTGFG